MTVHVQKSGRSMSISWERPPLNVLSIELLRELDAELLSCAAQTDVDVVIFRGAGERAFSAGVDIRDHTPEKVPEMLEVVHGVIRKLVALPQVSVAAVRGLCLGGGLEVASSCDLIVASDDSVFATPEILVGCYPPVAMARFAALLGYHRAAEMILTGRRFSAGEAQSMGLVNRVFAAKEWDAGVATLRDDLLGKSGAVLRLAVKGLRELALAGFDPALRRSEELYCRDLLRTADVAEGVEAFLAKRTPVWQHR